MIYGNSQKRMFAFVFICGNRTVLLLRWYWRPRRKEEAGADAAGIQYTMGKEVIVLEIEMKIFLSSFNPRTT